MASYEHLSEAVIVELRKLQQVELSMVKEILAKGQSEGSMAFAGTVEAQALVIVTSMKGAVMYARDQGVEFLDLISQQHRESLRTH